MKKPRIIRGIAAPLGPADRRDIHVHSGKLFEQAASKETKAALDLLDKAVMTPENPTGAQMESASRSREVLKKVARDFWAKGYVDVTNRAARIEHDRRINNAVRQSVRDLRSKK